MIFTINIITDTKEGDAFDAVAVNKFPIIYESSDIDSLFGNDTFTAKVREMLKAENLFNNAKAYVRSVSDSSDPKDEVFLLTEKMKWKK